METVAQVAVGAVIAANIIDLIASLLQIYSGYVKEKKQILFWQTLQIGLQTFSMILLGAFTGAVGNVLSVIRNIICYKDRMNTPVKVVLIAIQFLLTIVFWDGTFAAWLPFIVCTVYIIFMGEKDPIRFKILVTATFVPWFFYYLVYRSYTGAFFAAATILTNIVALIQMKKKKNKKQEEN